MPLLLFFVGTLCVGMATMIALFYLFVSQIEGARTPGDGIFFFLMGLGPMSLGMLLYFWGWQLM
ncbi:MAG: hypothetical protein H6642_08815 [Caldilineaceae bacterium]|nr:hypothetical protein [Caldilineaceae bacterium]